MGGTGANRSDATRYALWAGTSADNTNWLGVLSGFYGSGLNLQGSRGYWWSSTAYSGTNAYNLYLGSGSTGVSPAYNVNKIYGFAVRCVL